MDWITGTDLAYRHGVYVAPPIRGWTLAHGEVHHGCFDPESDDLTGWLVAMSWALGEVHYYATHRVSESHQWAMAVDGELRRMFGHCGMSGETYALGEPTEAEIELGVGTMSMTAGWQQWTDEQWDAFNATLPDEFHVMKIAERWSIDPTKIRNDSVQGDGIHGAAETIITD